MKNLLDVKKAFKSKEIKLSYVKIYKDDAPETASVVPLAFPLIAGAGTMTSLVSLQAEYEMVNIIVAIVINIIFVYLVLKSSGKIEKVLGAQGINVISDAGDAIKSSQ